MSVTAAEATAVTPDRIRRAKARKKEVIRAHVDVAGVPAAVRIMETSASAHDFFDVFDVTR